MAIDFLVEIGTEELPPKALKSLSESFDRSIRDNLTSAGFHLGSTIRYATPRRLAVWVKDLDEKQADQQVEKLGPAVKAAFDGEGKPTKAAEGFARSNGVTVDQLEQLETDKGLRLAYRSVQEGKTAIEELPGVVQLALDSLPIPKKMKWGDKKEEFVRPVHWVVMLLGEETINCEILGISASNLTYGHRFHAPQAFPLRSASNYESSLKEQGYVIPSFGDRRNIIKQQVQEQGAKISGIAQIDGALLDEVTALVEWPVALAGRFEERFLEVPAAALISSMKKHQKYFHVEDNDSKLLPYFITVANIESTDPQQIIAGNERVIRPRLADAAFFYETDKKTTLAAQSEKLKNVVFQKQLGSIYDKTERVAKLAVYIADQIGADAKVAEKAALLSKADLVSEMVFEFEDLQGVMGFHYATLENQAAELAQALDEQYWPRFAGDDLPISATGQVLALADRLDTLVGIFGIGQPPTGNKDPFALRRASLGVLNIIVKKELDLDLRDLLAHAQQNYPTLPSHEGLVDTVLHYMIERFRAWYNAEHIATEVFLAVNAKGVSAPLDFDRRVQAVNAFAQQPAASSLAAANKRVSNILLKQAGDINSITIDESLLQESAEQCLAQQISSQAESIKPLLQDKDYKQALTNLAALKEPVDQFFDNVMIMVDDGPLRNNRIALLHHLRQLFLEVADISLLVPNK